MVATIYAKGGARMVGVGINLLELIQESQGVYQEEH